MHCNAPLLPPGVSPPESSPTEPVGVPVLADRDTKPDSDDFEGFTSVTKLRAEPEATTQTGLRAPRLSKPFGRLPPPSLPPRPSLAVSEEEEPSTRLRPAATRPSLPPPELALTPAMTPILPPPLAGLVQERTVVLTLPPIDPTPPPDVAIRTPFAMAVPPEDRDTRVLAPAPLQAEVLGQRLPLSRVALIVGSTLVVAAIIVVGLRPKPPTAPAAPPAEPVTSMPAPAVPPVAAASAPEAVAVAHPPAPRPATPRRGGGHRRIPTRRDP